QPGGGAQRRVAPWGGPQALRQTPAFAMQRRIIIIFPSVLSRRRLMRFREKASSPLDQSIGATEQSRQNCWTAGLGGLPYRYISYRSSSICSSTSRER